MELDELKQYLKEQKTLPETVNRPAEHLSTLLKSNPKSPVNKIRKSMQFELILNILFSLLCLYGLIVLKIWSLRIYTIIILIVCLLSIIALVAFSKKINQLTNTLLPVKKNLEEVYAIMKAFVKRYFQFVMSLIPFTFVLTFSLGYYQGKTSDVPAFDSLAKSFTHLNYLIIATIVYVAAVTIGAYYFTKWYLRKLYGKYMDELKALLAELEE